MLGAALGWPDAVTALAPSILIIVSYFFAQRNAVSRHNSTQEGQDQIHTLVNDRLDVALERIVSLEGELRAQKGHKP
jgi:hypothetical protein